MVDGISSKLSNRSFLERAPGDVIERERDKLENFSTTLEKLKRNYSLLVRDVENR